MNKSETIASLAPALVAAQAEIKNPAFNAKNPHYKSNYVNLAGLRDAITPVLSRHGLAATQLLSTGAEGEVCCETMLIHSSGEWISEIFCIKPGKADAHGCGSAATYARRYALAAMIGVAGEDDDDGNATVAPGATGMKPAVEAPRAKKTLAAYQAEADTHKEIESLTTWYKANEANIGKDLTAADTTKLLAHLTKLKTKLSTPETVHCPDGGVVLVDFCANECGKREGCPAQ